MSKYTNPVMAQNIKASLVHAYRNKNELAIKFIYIVILSSREFILSPISFLDDVFSDKACIVIPLSKVRIIKE